MKRKPGSKELLEKIVEENKNETVIYFILVLWIFIYFYVGL